MCLGEFNETVALKLIDEANSGNEVSRNKLFIILRPRILWMAEQFARNKNDAEDITQEACINLHLYLHTYKPGYDLLKWLYVVTKNAAIAFLEKFGDEEILDGYDLDQVAYVPGEADYCGPPLSASGDVYVSGKKYDWRGIERMFGART